MTITLISGRTADTDRISFDPVTLQFVLMGQNITEDINRADKVAIWNIDVDRENQRIFANKYARDHDGALPKQLPTDTLTIFENRLLTDPFSEPLAALDRTFQKIIAAPAIQKIGVALAIVGVVYLVWKLKKD